MVEREDYNKRKDEFLEKFDVLHSYDLLFYPENYLLAVELPLKGIDLDRVKNINYSELAPLTHRGQMPNRRQRRWC